jgi:hypothetical protein
VVVGAVVRNNETRNGWQCTDAEKGRSARSLPLAHLLQAGRQAGREAFTQARLVRAAALYATTLRYAVSALCRPLVALILSPSPISRLGHAVFWPQLQVRRYLHTPTDALTLLGPNASPSCYSTHFYS